jgi:hypothetical protein
MCSISHPQPLHSTHYLQPFTPPASPLHTLPAGFDTPSLCIVHIIPQHLGSPASAIYTLCAAFPTPSLCILHIICSISPLCLNAAPPFYTLLTAFDTPRLCILHIIYSHSHHQPLHCTHYLQDLTHPASALYTLFLSILDPQPLQSTHYVQHFPPPASAFYTLFAAIHTTSLSIAHITCRI